MLSKIVQMTMKEMCFYTYIGTKLSIVQALSLSLSLLAYQLAVCSCLLLLIWNEMKYDMIWNDHWYEIFLSSSFNIIH